MGDIRVAFKKMLRQLSYVPNVYVFPMADMLSPRLLRAGKVLGGRLRLAVLACSLNCFDVELRCRAYFLFLFVDITRDAVEKLAALFKLLALLSDDGVGFAHASLLRGRIAINTDGLYLAFYCLLQCLIVEANDHDGQVVCREAVQCVLDKSLGRSLRVFDVADEVYCLLI